MKQNIFTVAALLAAVCCLCVSSAQAQSCAGCGPSKLRVAIDSARAGLSSNFDSDGRVLPKTGFVTPRTTLRKAARDQFSPTPVYAYSTEGLRAGQVHSWNQGQQNAHSWQGGYNTWRFGQPTALVVPPTASYQSTYAWGVGQTRSTPIHHQFGRGAGSFGGTAGGFANAPYFPSNTNQFGYYPVRGSW